MKFFTLALLFVVLCFHPAAAQQVAWDGGGDGTSWSDAANWNPDGVPNSLDDVVIDYNPGSDYTVVLASAATVESLRLTTTRVTLELQADLAVSAAASFEAGNLSGAGDLTVGGLLTWQQGTMSGIGTTRANGGMEITGGSGSGKVLDGRELILSSGQTATHTGLSFYGSNGGTLRIESGAVFNLTGDNNYNRFAVASTSTAAPQIVNHGTFQKTDGTTFRVDVGWDFVNDGMLELDLEGGHLQLQGAITDSDGTYRATAGQLDFLAMGETFTFGSGSLIEGAGTVDFSGGSATIEGTYDVTGVTEVSGGGNQGATVVIASTATLTNLGDSLLEVHDRGSLTVNTTAPLTVGRLEQNFQGVLTLSSPLTVAGDFILGNASALFQSDFDVTVGGEVQWRGGTVAGAGTVFANGGMVTTGGPGSASWVKVLDQKRLIIPTGQTATHSGAYFSGRNGAVIEIEQGGSLELVESYRAFEVGDGVAPRIENAGLISKSSGSTSTLNVYWGLLNSGTVEVDQADAHVQLRGAITDSDGTYRATAGRLDFFAMGETFTFGSGSRIEGAATVDFSGGTATIEGTYDVTGVTEVSGGGNQGASVVIASTSTLNSLGDSLLKVHDRGSLTVNTTDPLTVGRLEQNFQGILTMSSPLTVMGDFILGNASARFQSDFDLTVGGEVQWRGGTMAGTGTTFANGGLTTSGGPGSASWVKVLDQRRVVLPSGQTAVLGGAYLSGRNGALLDIRENATVDMTESYRVFQVGEGSAPRIENAGTIRKSGGSTGTLSIEWEVVNHAVVEIDHAEGHLRLVGRLDDQGGSYRAVAGKLDLAPPTSTESYVLGPASEIFAAAGATVTFASEPADADSTIFSILGTFDVGGTSAVSGSGRVAAVTISESANLVRLGSEALRVGANRGSLVVNSTEPQSVGDLTVGFMGTLVLQSALTVTGDYHHTNSTSTLDSEFDVTVGGSLTWDGGTMTGSGTTVVEDGLNVYGSAGSSSNVKRLDGRRLVVAAGDGVFDGALFGGGNGAVLEIAPNASWDVAPSRNNSSMSVFSGSTEPPRLVNRGSISTSLDGAIFQTAWPMENAGTVDLGQGALVLEPQAGLGNSGMLVGSGNIVGDVTNSGTISPGSDLDPIGTIDVNGALAQDSLGSMVVEIGGTAAGTGYDVVSADEVALDGTLDLELVDGFTPGADDILQVIRWADGQRTGSFSAIEGQEAGSALLAVRYGSDALEIYDGSLPEPPPPPQISVDVDSPPFQRRGRSVSASATVTNSGDASVTRIRLRNIQVGLPPAGTTCPTDDAYENLRCRMERFGVTPPPPEEGESYPFLASVGFPGPLSGGGGGGSGDGTTLTGSFSGSGSLEFSGSEECESQSVDMGVEVGVPVTDDDLSGCAYEVAKLALDFVPGYDCFKLATSIGTSIGEGLHGGQFDLTGYLASNMVGAVNCAGDAVPATKAIKIMLTLNDLASKAGGIQGVSDACGSAAGQSATASSSSSNTTCVASSDPNDKFGPPGVGADRFVTPADTLPFVVFFENKPEATAPAQIVTISDTLDLSVVDPSTFSFGMVAWGDTSVSLPDDQFSITQDVDLRPDLDLITRVEADLNEETGILSWTFTSLDPETMELTADPLAGFLPPNETVPEGEGLVSYFVEPFDTLATDPHFGYAARIIFDDNDPIDTPVWSNAIDATAPSSQVAELDPVQTTTEFDVSWSGTDAGSGVHTYTVFAATDGGAYEEWLTETTDTTATFEGVDGETYAFYSLAIDSVGNAEAKSPTAEAETVIDLSAVGVEEQPLPESFDLMEPYPNPFAQSSTIGYALPKTARVRIVLYDALGRAVKTLVDRRRPAGRYDLNLESAGLASGTYICVMESDAFRASRTVLVVK